MRIWQKLRDVFGAMSGGEKMTAAWKPDHALRAAARKINAADSRLIEGGLFLEDLKEFLDAIDGYNLGREPRHQFSMVINEKQADRILTHIMKPRQSAYGISYIGGLGLERNGRVYRGEYFNDHVLNTGFVFRTGNVHGRYLCNLPVRSNFAKLAEDLLQAPVNFSGPIWAR